MGINSRYGTKQILKNMELPPIKVKHADLERFDDRSPFKSVCPKCKDGVLLMRRDQKTLTLLAEDNCVACGRPFIYTDIEDLRKAEK